MHVTKPSRVFPQALILHAHLDIRSVVSFGVCTSWLWNAAHMPLQITLFLSMKRRESPTSQSSPSFSLQVHEAAASLNAKKKADDKEKGAAKRKAANTLTMPQTVSVSALQVSLEDAKKKRDEAKKEAKVESNKVKLARKRVERVKAKAKELSNNDLYEVYLMRMQAEKVRKAAEEAKVARHP